jgi:hypothetical protein
MQEPYDYFGAPLHRMFWRNFNVRNLAPAQALFEAKAEFLLYIASHPLKPKVEWDQYTRDQALAFEMKAFWSETYLGLGW